MKISTNSNPFKRLFLWFALGSSLILFSCQPEGNVIEDIANQIKVNNCRIQTISNYVDDSWTVSIEELGRLLPKDLPQQERENILNLKNADLIRMFESYKYFSPSVHSLVDSMEQVDYQWADSLRNLSQQNQKLEMKIDSLFSTMQDAETEKMLYQQVQEIKSSPCKDLTMEE